MLAEMTIAFSVTDVFTADIAHLIATDTGELVAAGGLNKGGVASRTGAFDGKRHSELDLCAES